MVRLRDDAIILTAATSVDDLTDESLRDWTKPPAETPTRFYGQPVSTTEETVTADTVVARWRGFLPPDAPVTSASRIRWHGDDYEIEGDVEVHRRGGTARYLAVTLKRVVSG